MFLSFIKTFGVNTYISLHSLLPIWKELFWSTRYPYLWRSAVCLFGTLSQWGIRQLVHKNPPGYISASRHFKYLILKIHTSLRTILLSALHRQVFHTTSVNFLSQSILIMKRNENYKFQYGTINLLLKVILCPGEAGRPHKLVDQQSKYSHQGFSEAKKMTVMAS